MSISVLSLNVRGLRDKVKRKAVFDYYRNFCDIICLQETHSMEEDEKLWMLEWGHDILFSHGTSASRGCATLIKKDKDVKVNKNISDKDGRFIITELDYAGVCFTLINLYAPNNDSPGFFENLFKITQENTTEKRVYIGDYNLTLDVELDRKNSYHNNNKSKNFISEYCEQNYLEDTWRVKNLGTRRYSWFKKNPISASRIDFALILQGFSSNVENITYTTGIKSDHSAIFISLMCHQNIRGPGFWKLNTSHLQDANYISVIKDVINRIKCESDELDPIDTWEYMKTQVKQASIDYSKNSTSEKRLIIAQLSEKVAELEETYENLSENSLDLLYKTKNDLSDLCDERANSLIFRSKVRWYEMGEKNTKYFMSLEKKRFNARTMNIMKNAKGECIYNDRDILKLQREYYQELFTKDPSVNFDLRNETGIVIDSECVAASNIPFSIQEITQAIRNLKNGKTPGCDGLPIEWYKVFWIDIREMFQKLITAVYLNRKTSGSTKEGIINLIPKPGKDSSEIKNLRPITLLNCDYKVMEKLIANRMEVAMNDIISNDQQGFMKNRSIIKNIRKISELIRIAEEEDVPAMILQIDWSKCFDKIDPTAITGSLEYFGFSQYIITWIELLYRGFTAKVQNNGYFSEPIMISRSVHQGAPCSSYIFLLCAEIFAIHLRECDKILGLTVHEFEYLLGQYADDTDLSMAFNQQSMDEVNRIIDLFRKQAGFTINYDKTMAYRIGSIRDTDAELITQETLSWTNEGINVLGVFVHADNNIMLEKKLLKMC